MTDLFAVADDILDTNSIDRAAVRSLQGGLYEVLDGVAVVQSFANLVAVRHAEGLFVFDAPSHHSIDGVLEQLRSWSTAPITHLVYSHGHRDHTGGAAALLADAEARGHARPTVIGHVGVRARLRRYERTAGYNAVANARQFAGILDLPDGPDPDLVEPDTVFDDALSVEVGGLHIELRHARGETDDHAWAWLPRRGVVLCGDFMIWGFPNAGNPQKVQRYAGEWAAALRDMVRLAPEYVVPAHGLPIRGAGRVATVLGDTAAVLESLEEQTLELMNAGATLDEVIHTVRPPSDLLDRPYLEAFYDDPEFVVRNIWRLYGGWWDGDPARLRPPRDADTAAEVLDLAGGVTVVAERVRHHLSRGSLRLAGRLAEWCWQADPTDPDAAAVRAEVFTALAERDGSIMAQGIFGGAAREAEQSDRRQWLG